MSTAIWCFQLFNYFRITKKDKKPEMMLSSIQPSGWVWPWSRKTSAIAASRRGLQGQNVLMAEEIDSSLPIPLRIPKNRWTVSESAWVTHDTETHKNTRKQKQSPMTLIYALSFSIFPPRAGEDTRTRQAGKSKRQSPTLVTWENTPSLSPLFTQNKSVCVYVHHKSENIFILDR